MKALIFLFVFLVALVAVYFLLPASTEEFARPPVSDEHEIAILAQKLSVPWDLAVFPDGSFLISERTGKLIRIQDDTRIEIKRPVAAQGEGGLLGLELDPNFKENSLIYLYETQQNESGGLSNHVIRLRFDLDFNTLSDEHILLEGIPGARNHDGGRLRFGPDGYLYITTGDAGKEEDSQNISSLAGKILRIDKEGGIPSDNPFGNEVYSYGHRNPQGIAWDEQDRLWSTEHGRSGVLSGYDELNLIRKGGNYGWPLIQGDEVREGMISPVLHSGPRETWAPASLAYINGKLYWAGLRGQSLYHAEISGDSVSHFRESFHELFGRLRTVLPAADGSGLYMTTSNTDGRGRPGPEDDLLLFLPLKEL